MKKKKKTEIFVVKWMLFNQADMMYWYVKKK
jgi:hypothetical protein